MLKYTDQQHVKALTQHLVLIMGTVASILEADDLRALLPSKVQHIKRQLPCKSFDAFDVGEFDADCYAYEVIQTLAVTDLLKLHAGLVREIRTLDAQLQSKVQQTNWQEVFDAHAALVCNINILEVQIQNLRTQAEASLKIAPCTTNQEAKEAKEAREAIDTLVAD